MRPQKLSPEQILSSCALQFKAHGYAGTSMEMLAKACGLSKASFYYYYPNKEALLFEVLNNAHQYLKRHLFSIAENTEHPVQINFQRLHQHAVQFFSVEVKGCLIGILSLEAIYLSENILAKIKAIFQDWQAAFYRLFRCALADDEAQQLAKISIADYEGAILMYRLHDDLFYLKAVKKRILQALNLQHC
ncbi:TetR/AcrR family transcriptional regulator [Acinetobacter sp. ANC 3832]|uniref:TetR/AcrR family transcriptional regulator n=1 Tax=Acinetobacter sp. ANC 3832 TaxID=1977874 RepID=UPI000A33EC57|nr:TetR/AcrR family transcriptional regulator [Acinetobacter sp. ANC 3832]OTG93060.1 TetR family transcriptional regulator [Acinetobacter sp. ANC 3832]